jgi:D-isomer specific 2-hydroxyacid dehydrogenase NAD-binding
MDQLLAESDFVTLHCPLTPQTDHIVNQEFLQKMKPSAYLINTSRGPVIDEAALAQALEKGALAGAGVDVLSTEPPTADNPLLTAKNCLITPHIAWAGYETRGRLLRICEDNLRAFCAGAPIHVVNP